MIDNMDICAKCGGEMRYYDCVKRIVKEAGGKKSIVYISRYQCIKCHSIHRRMPEELLPFKQYDAEIIRGVQEGLIDEETFGYEDYPCSETMKRWKTENFFFLTAY